MNSKTLLIVCNTPSVNTQSLANAVYEGATDDAIDNVIVTLKQPLEVTPNEVLKANGVLLGTTENFGYMSGLMKDFLERIYYPCLEHTEGKPYALYVKAGNDGEGAKQSVERIITGLSWKAIRPTTVLTGPFNEDFREQCHELGMSFAAGLEAGIY